MFTFVVIITCYNNKHTLILRFTNVNIIIIQHLKPHLSTQNKEKRIIYITLQDKDNV